MKHYVTIEHAVFFRWFTTNCVFGAMSGQKQHILEHYPHYLFIRELNIYQKQKSGIDMLFGFSL